MTGSLSGVAIPVPCCSLSLGGRPELGAEARRDAEHGVRSCRKRTARTHLPWAPCPPTVTLLGTAQPLPLPTSCFCGWLSPSKCLAHRALAVLALLSRLGFSRGGSHPSGRVTIKHCQWVLPVPMLPSLGEVSSRDLERREPGGSGQSISGGSPTQPWSEPGLARSHR